MNERNENVGLAGWLFADLTLVLMFIFLAVGFVLTVQAADDEIESAQPSSTTTTTTLKSFTSTSSTTTTTTVKICPGIEPLGVDNRQKGLRLSFVTGTPEQQQQLRDSINAHLDAAIGLRLAEQGLQSVDPATISVGYILVYGGTGGGTIDSGRQRAQRFIDQIDQLMPERFIGAAGGGIEGRNFYHSGSTDEIWIEYFPRVPVLDGDC